VAISDPQIVWKVDEEDNLRAYHKKDLKNPAVWAPQPGSQTMFLTCPVFECLFAGTRGNGKTDALLMDFLQHVGQGYGPDWRGVLFRRTFPELKDVINKAYKWFPKIFPTAQYNKASSTWTFQDGEQLIFGFVEKEADYWKYHGHNYSWQGWEELTTWPDDSLFKRLISTVRSTNKNVPAKIRATCNPSGCVPYGDVLTTRGWVDIQDVTTEDFVVSTHKNGDSCVRQVTETHAYDFDGELYERNARGIHLSFTEDHRWPLLNTDCSQHTVKSFQDLPKYPILRRSANPETWEGVEGEEVTRVYPGFTKNDSHRKPKSPIIKSLLVEDYAELLGWFVSKGCLCKRDQAFCIAQSKVENLPTIRALLDRCGFHYRYDGQAFWISERYWMQHFAAQGKCRTKHIPRWFLNQPAPVLQGCLDALMLGDRHHKTYYTISRQLADDVSEIMTKLGMANQTHARYRENREGLHYSIGWQGTNKTTLTKKELTRRKYSGKVFCITVADTETFFLRQGKHVFLSGNSGHNWVKRRYGLPVIPGTCHTHLKKTEGEPDRIAIHGSLSENKILLHANPHYIDRLRASCTSPAEAAAWIDGSWDITSGGMFDDIWDADCHVAVGLRAEHIPEGWRIDRSYDHGQSKPFSVGFWAESNGEPVTLPSGRTVGHVRGDLFRFNEWYGQEGDEDNVGMRLASTEIAEGIVQRIENMDLMGRVYPGVADASIFDQWEPGKTVAGDMKSRGIRWLAADKSKGSRIQGWQQIRKMLKAAKPTKTEDGNYIRESPGLFVSDNCEHFLRTFPILSRDKKNPDDVDTNIEDHIADEVRYRCRAKRAKRARVYKG